MKTQHEIEAAIKNIEKSYSHVLTGSVATINSNAPRALVQLEAETKLQTLHWAIGTNWKSKLKGVDC